jgi:hypothetical protein
MNSKDDHADDYNYENEEYVDRIYKRTLRKSLRRGPPLDPNRLRLSSN